MGEAFITRRGGAGTSFANIVVKYPIGATCTCTNGAKTLIAKDTSGAAIFYIPATGTWTVAATLGSKSASKSVSITTKGQIESVELIFDLILFDGTDNTAITGGFKMQIGNGSSATISDAPISDGKISLWKGDAYVGAYPANKVDITNYSTLYVNVNSAKSFKYVATVGIIRSDLTVQQVMDYGAYGGTGFAAKQDFVKGDNSLIIPVDALSGEQQFLFMYYSEDSGEIGISNIHFT